MFLNYKSQMVNVTILAKLTYKFSSVSIIIPVETFIDKAR